MGGGSSSRIGGYRRLLGLAATVGAAVLAAWPAGASAEPGQPTRFSLAGGCYSLTPAGGGGPIAAAARQRLRATDLASYLLFGTAHDFLAASGDGVSRAAQPSPAAAR